MPEETKPYFEKYSDRDSFVRWQAITIKQLGYTSNLISTFSVAALGYSFTLLKDADYKNNTARLSWILTTILFFFSLCFALFVAVNRLHDFRGTAERARKKAGAPFRGLLRILGRRTWCAFYTQLVLFGLGVFTLAVTTLELFGSKLIPR
jgi:uncharacterized membrane protein YhaH (DUF805 family)